MGSAIISEDGLYRYRLDRFVEGVDPLRTLAVFGVNPSKADAQTNDPTIVRTTGFSRSFKCGHFIMLNKFAWRDTEVKNLPVNPEKAIGPDNDRYIAAALEEADVVMVAWGTLGKLPSPSLHKRWKDIVKLIDAAGHTAMCLGTGNDGHPKHPLYIKGTTALTPWPVPWFAGRTSHSSITTSSEDWTAGDVARALLD